MNAYLFTVIIRIRAGSGMVMPKFHYIYLAQNLLKTRSPTCFEQVSDMSQTSKRPKKVGDLVSDKIDLSRHVEIDLAASFRQIKKSGTWSQTSFHHHHHHHQRISSRRKSCKNFRAAMCHVFHKCQWYCCR